MASVKAKPKIAYPNNCFVKCGLRATLVINAEKIKVSGKKQLDKFYRRHSGQVGGMKLETFDELQNRLPGKVIEKAIKGMLPKGPLGRHLYTKLKVYKGDQHPHNAQNPEIVNI